MVNATVECPSRSETAFGLTPEAPCAQVGYRERGQTESNRLLGQQGMADARFLGIPKRGWLVSAARSESGGQVHDRSF